MTSIEADLETVETYIECDGNGRIERIVPRVRNDAHKLIEECMLAANVCAADFLARHKQPALYRVHEGPTPDRLATVRGLLKSLGLSLEGGDKPEPSDYAALVRKIQGRPDVQLLQMVLLRSMQQAVYTPHNGGHFGLAFPQYTHFTSPIRRYPDLLTHRAIRAILAGKTFEPQVFGGMEAARLRTRGSPPSIESMSKWEKLGMLCSANERRADDASRDVEAWLKSYYMRERVGETFSGTINAVVPFGLFVVLDDLFVEGLVHVSELGSEYFSFNEALHELRGERTGLRFRLADRVTVQVARVDLEARRIDFRLVKAMDRKTLLQDSAAKTATRKKPARKGESVEERKARKAAIAARKPRDIDKRERARAGRGPRMAAHAKTRGRGR
jgi:ribonuclease R